VQLGCLRPAIPDCQLDQDVLGRFLGILDKDVEVTILIENPGMKQFIFKLVACTSPVRLNQV
jgi:hypothetical protein